MSVLLGYIGMDFIVENGATKEVCNSFFMVGTILQVLTVCKQYYHKRSISEILKYLSQLYS